MRQLVDITVPLTPQTPIYPGDPATEVTRVFDQTAGDEVSLTRIACSAHAGTHVDAPVHILPDGGGVEVLPLDVLLGAAWVADAGAGTDHLDAAALDALNIPPGTTRLLIKTRNSVLWDDPRFTEDYVALTEDGAATLVDAGIRLVGVDYLSVAPYSDPAPVHRVLLEAGVVILETLDLRGVEPGPWDLLCLPILIPGSDGAPARAVLSRELP